MSFPEIGLCHASKSYNWRLDEFPRNWSSSCPGNLPIKVKSPTSLSSKIEHSILANWLMPWLADYDKPWKTCYATDSPEFSQMNIFHYLISSMCAHPSDQTVQIHTNGISDKVRFSFNMFRFTESFSYIYLHCEGNFTIPYKVGCGLPMVISSDFRMGKNRNDHDNDAP